MEGFWFGVVVTLGVCVSVSMNLDTSVELTEKRMTVGKSYCNDRGGFVSYDSGNDFTCKDGTVLHKKEF